MLRAGQWILLAALLPLLAGCRSNRSELRAPGTMEQQQIRATIFDPYSDPFVAPAIEGGRPRDYQQPLTESERSRLFRTYWQSF